ncbi:hypothetical protein [Nostoc linckia]|uniref:hypothetical protein n=1 Tax=Nostoc linckia TaxID=92942 RepID=UPI0015D522E9|nr:hypothetical protein [Nostoc linckia]
MGRWGDEGIGKCGECGECGGKDFFLILPHLPHLPPLPHFLLAPCPMPNTKCPLQSLTLTT